MIDKRITLSFLLRSLQTWENSIGLYSDFLSAKAGWKVFEDNRPELTPGLLNNYTYVE